MNGMNGWEKAICLNLNTKPLQHFSTLFYILCCSL